MIINKLYKVTQKLGRGSFGAVSQAIDLVTGRIVALKTCEMVDDGIPYTAIREMSILKTLQGNSNIVTVHDVIVESNNDDFHIVFECYPLTLSSYIEGYRRHGIHMSVKTIHSLALQLCSAMAYCHGKFIMHRDLKPCNIMMTNDLTLKIGDFGISRYMSYPFGPNTKEIVTLYYRPPEILLGETVYDFTVDSWSVGWLLTYSIDNRWNMVKATEYLARIQALF